ncbi:MAG: response regulator [Leptolyngbyaceae cyanobacterium CRU_2_3]|nr:response regulator [Leptolyngbyaceae cyanobacterium CRU_2_3]
MKILVVEDDGLLAKALTTVLTDQTYAVEVASDGEAGWNLIELYAYDLVLLDVVLPRLDGISLCRRVRSHGYQMPILLLTGRDSSHDKAIGLDAGADDYVVKPFDPEELAARVRALLRRGAVTAAPVLKWGNLRLDPGSCEVTYAEQSLPLTPKEYALLELFLRNPQRIFSCGMVLEHLWAFEEIPGEDAVRTHIKGLRQKLKAAGETNLIETVYGIGYRLKATEAKVEVRTPKTTQPLPESDLRQQTLAAIAGIWEKFQGRIDQQITVLEQAAAALEQQTLSQPLRQQAIQEAHTLGGSLGTFGLPDGSEMARTMERLLKSDALLPDQVSMVRDGVSRLRQITQRSPHSLISPSISSSTSPSISSSTTNSATGAVTDQVTHGVTGAALGVVTPTQSNPLHPKVMVVDDDPMLFALLQQILEPWGMTLTPLEDPRQFWDILEATSPDLLILDIEMPYINGIELCQAVREHSRWSHLPILFLTVHTHADRVNQVYTVGADDFVSKPIVGPELVTRILNRLERIKLLQATTAALHQAKLAGSEKSKDQLELRVAERTAELISINEQLRIELRERQQIEEALRVSQIRFAGILEIADDAIIAINSTQHITLFNQGAEKIFGYTAPEVMNQPLDLLLPVRFAPAHWHHVVDFAQMPQPARRMGERREIFGRRKTGEEFPAEASISRLEVEGDTVFTVILRDITARKQAEQALEQLSRQNELLLNSVGEGLCGLNLQGHITFVNPAAARLLGYAITDLINQPIQCILPDAENSLIWASLQDGMIHQALQSMFYRQDGSSFPVEYASTPIREQGAIVGRVITFQDITERQLVERMKNEFISVVSHELRTPLTSIHGSLGMLSSGLLDAQSETGKRLLEIAVNSTDRLVRLINDILDIERIESGQVMMTKQICDVSELMTKAVEVMQVMAEKFGVTIVVSPLATSVWADPDRLIQTLTNLLSNAIKFSPSGSTVWLKAELGNGEWGMRNREAHLTPYPPHPTPAILCTIKDQGRGIPQDKLETIFERFQQVDASDSRNQDGTGLGLAICRNIVQQHGGRIWVESVLGEGSTFYFTLPIEKKLEGEAIISH